MTARRDGQLLLDIPAARPTEATEKNGAISLRPRQKTQPTFTSPISDQLNREE